MSQEGIDLFAPFKIRNLELRNRFIRSATYDGFANSHGAVTDDSVAIYDKLASADIGLVVTGFAFVSRLGQTLPNQLGVYDDRLIPGLKRLSDAVHRGGGKIALQIAHAGLNSNYLPQKGIGCLAVSPRKGEIRPHREMSDAEIEGILADFAAAARRGREAGFDAIQLHGAHTYLLSQFLSPLFNHRTDRWGGGLENRSRFHIELIRQVRRTIGNDFPLLIKFGIQDDLPDGLTLAEGIEVARWMVKAGIDAIEVSWGMALRGYVVKKGEVPIPTQRARAARLKRAVDVPVAVVEGIRSLEIARNIVNSGDADLIAMARPLIREPGLIARWHRGDTRPSGCICCGRCIPGPTECRGKS